MIFNKMKMKMSKKQKNNNNNDDEKHTGYLFGPTSPSRNFYACLSDSLVTYFGWRNSSPSLHNEKSAMNSYNLYLL